MQTRRTGPHGHEQGQPCCHDPQRDYDAQTSWVCFVPLTFSTSLINHFLYYSLDSIANNIATATFDVINGGKVKTADMGGLSIQFDGLLSMLTTFLAGSATTSEFTSAIIKNL